MNAHIYSTSDNNLFDASATDTTKGYVDNYFLQESGTEETNNSWAISEYIAIPTGTTQLTVNTAIGANASICFYDDDKEFKLGEKYNNRTTFTVNVTSEHKYFRLSIYKPYASDFSVKSNALAWRDYTPNIYAHGENLFDDAAANKVVAGKYIDSAGVEKNNNLPGTSTLNHTSYMPVTGGSEYTYKWHGPIISTPGMVVAIIWYTSNKEFIERTTKNLQVGTDFTLQGSAPPNAAYAILNFPSETWPNPNVTLQFYETALDWRESTAHKYSSGSWD